MWPLAALGVAALVLWQFKGQGGGTTTPTRDEPMNMDPSLPRGLRNNNPGNIRLSDDAWQGLADTQTDSEFFQFIKPFYGIRALAKTLKTYRDRYGLYTVRGIINRWAPPTENITTAYVSQVAGHMGVSADAPLNWGAAQLRGLVQAIIRHENGRQPYSAAELDDAIRAAGW